MLGHNGNWKFHRTARGHLLKNCLFWQGQRWTDKLESLGSVPAEINVPIVLFPQLKKRIKTTLKMNICTIFKQPVFLLSSVKALLKAKLFSLCLLLYLILLYIPFLRQESSLNTSGLHLTLQIKLNDAVVAREGSSRLNRPLVKFVKHGGLFGYFSG